VLAPSVAKVNAVLQLANERPLRPYTITSRLGHGWLHNKTVSALRTLERIGIVRPVQRQRHTEYEPNPESPYADVAHQIALIDLGIHDLLPASSQVMAIYVHGSVAEGSANPDSDLDVLLIGKIDPREARAALAPVERMLGRSLDVTVRSAAEVRDAIAAGDAFVTEILSRGVRVWGIWR
jgi:predicted nucleotidyltransferase